MSVAAMLTQTATVQSLAVTRDDLGGPEQTWTTYISSMPCMLRNKTVNEVSEFGKRTSRNVFMLYCEYNSTNSAIDVKDRMIIDSRLFQVRQPYDPAGKGVLLQIELEEID